MSSGLAFSFARFPGMLSWALEPTDIGCRGPPGSDPRHRGSQPRRLSVGTLSFDYQRHVITDIRDVSLHAKFRPLYFAVGRESGGLLLVGGTQGGAIEGHVQRDRLGHSEQRQVSGDGA